MKVAVITPYCNEPDEVVRRCFRSVRTQTTSAQLTHYFIADGPFPSQGWLDQMTQVRQVWLGERHDDCGGTPRSIGSLLAASEGADYIAYLDADNTYDPNHIELCLKTLEQNPKVDFIVAQRRILVGDKVIPDPLQYPDTNCYFLTRSAFPTLWIWALQPKILSKVGDALFGSALTGAGMTYAKVPVVTVNYYSNWENDYKLAGLPVPEGAKKYIEGANIQAWWDLQSPKEKDIIRRLICMPHFDIQPPQLNGAVARD